MVDTTQPAELVARILAGEKTAEAELVQRYKRGLSIILNRATGDRSLSEDLCQDTFQITLEKIRRGDIREPERLSGFICNLARNLATDHFRKSRRTQAFEDTDGADLIPAPAPSQLDRLMREEQAKMIRRLLAELSERDRQILLRFYIQEEDKEQICADLQLTSLHFNRVLHRARERYRERMERQKS
jgi:RNA polymerase sigma-70 factor (ECF subfamily)